MMKTENEECKGYRNYSTYMNKEKQRPEIETGKRKSYNRTMPEIKIRENSKRFLFCSPENDVIGDIMFKNKGKEMI